MNQRSNLKAFIAEQRKKLRQRMQRVRHPACLGGLRRTMPLSTMWGYDRGTPVDRYYIDHFLQQHHGDIRGRVLEVKDNDYTKRFGTSVTRSDVLDIDPSNQCATIVADLTAANAIRDNQFDCFVLTQTLQFIYDVRAAISHGHRILRPGGVLLATMPGISRMDRRMNEYWRFTINSCYSLFSEAFGSDQVTVSAYGNVRTATAFLMGMAYEELSQRELNMHDRHFPVIIAVRAVKCFN